MSNRCLSLVVLMILAACTRSGIIVDTEGNWLGATPDTVRMVHGQRLSQQLGKTLGEGWQVEAEIEALPAKDPFSELTVWLYPATTVRVASRGPAGELAPAERLVPIVQGFFRNRMQPRLDVERDLVIATALAEAASSPGVALVRPAEGWTYTVQDGDTLAMITAVFYGSAEHWRLLLAANPGLDPLTLHAGQKLQIPPPPEDD